VVQIAKFIQEIEDFEASELVSERAKTPEMIFNLKVGSDVVEIPCGWKPVERQWDEQPCGRFFCTENTS
jgi:hypothetical protein